MEQSHFIKYFLFCAGVFMLGTSACVPYNKLKYFNDIDKLSEPASNPVKSKTISPFDKLNIIVLSTDEETASILNISGEGPTTDPRGYVVDETGNINFPFAGKIQVANLTLLEAGEKINKVISSIIRNPEVIVNFIDKKITVIGEVVNQGTFLINDDFVNIYESLSLGGGLTEFADRKKVVLLRKENNKLTHYTLDLSDSKISSSPLFYIFPNDILIVEPLRNKSGSFQNSFFTMVLTSVATMMGIAAILLMPRNN